MIKVHMQKSNDCLKACIASIFEIPYEEAFDHNWNDDWVKNLKRWSALRYHIFHIMEDDINFFGNLKENIAYFNTDKLIGVGPSPRGNYDHAVVIDKDLNILHDPKDPCEQLTQIDYVMGFKEI